MPIRQKNHYWDIFLLLLFQKKISEIKWRAKSNFCFKQMPKKCAQRDLLQYELFYIKYFQDHIIWHNRKTQWALFQQMLLLIATKKMLYSIGHSALHQYYAMVKLSSGVTIDWCLYRIMLIHWLMVLTQPSEPIAPPILVCRKMVFRVLLCFSNYGSICVA